MPDIAFGDEERIIFPTRHHGEVTLSKTKWTKICSAPERHYYRENGEKIATTLINPDEVRHHQSEPNQLFYYKKFNTIVLGGVEHVRPSGIFFAAVVDSGTKRVCTVFPVKVPKRGKMFRPE